MDYIKQVIYELKNQKMMTWVSISGTALAIFLIMVIFMTERLTVLEISPVSQRSRILTGQSIEFLNNDRSGSGMGIHSDLAQRLYEGLEGIELIAYITPVWGLKDANLSGREVSSVLSMKVDHNFWKIYDYQFISGGPFDEEEIKSGKNIVVITESTARKIFGETDVAGRTMDIDNMPYEVKGVVKDQYPLLPDGNIETFLNYMPDEGGFELQEGFGNTNVRLLMKEGVKVDAIKKQVAHRYDELNRQISKQEGKYVYHQQPYTSAELATGFMGSNSDPALKEHQRGIGFIYFILLILPAINLNSMTRSRLRNRISEIGVRRAFGAKKKTIINQIFTENLIISVIGGILGLLVSLFVLLMFSDLFIANDKMLAIMGASYKDIQIGEVVWQIFDWETFFIALGGCFILNVLSATVPAWKAATVEPAVAISKTR